MWSITLVLLWDISHFAKVPSPGVALFSIKTGAHTINFIIKLMNISNKKNQFLLLDECSQGRAN